MTVNNEPNTDWIATATFDCPNLQFFTEGGFYWLDSDLWGNYNEIPVTYDDDEHELNSHRNCPACIRKFNQCYEFKRFYDDDNTYRLYVRGVETDKYYTLIDVEGNGYYTGLIGDACKFAMLRFRYNGKLVGWLPLFQAIAEEVSVSTDQLGIPWDGFNANDVLSGSFMETYRTAYIPLVTRIHKDRCQWGTGYICPLQFNPSITVGTDTLYLSELTEDDASSIVYFSSIVLSETVGDYDNLTWTFPDDTVVVFARYDLKDATGLETLDLDMISPTANYLEFTGMETSETFDLDPPATEWNILSVVGNRVYIELNAHRTIYYDYPGQVGAVTLELTDGLKLLVTATTKADPDDVTCQLYQCSADPRVVDKTDYLTNIQQLSGSWVVPFDEMSPVLRINLATNLATSGNYCRIYSTGWGTKYYFIKNRVCVGQEVWDLYLEEDVLMTFKSYFKTATGLIDRSESAYNLMIPDSTIPLEVGQNVTVREIMNDVFSDNYGFNYVLTGLMVGGETE